MTNGEWNFLCQHGPNECYGNQLHACVINQYPLSQSLEFVYCTMNSINPVAEEVLQQVIKLETCIIASVTSSNFILVQFSERNILGNNETLL